MYMHALMHAELDLEDRSGLTSTESFCLWTSCTLDLIDGVPILSGHRYIRGYLCSVKPRTL